jgi:hypothetical protein
VPGVAPAHAAGSGNPDILGKFYSVIKDLTAKLLSHLSLSSADVKAPSRRSLSIREPLGCPA